MTSEIRLWLVRHAPVAGSRDVIHDLAAPADTSDDHAFAALSAALPKTAPTYASPARRTLETAVVLGLAPISDRSLLEQDFGLWTGRRHEDLEKEFGAAYSKFWQAPAETVPPQGESFVYQVARVRDWIEKLQAGDVVLIVHSGTIRAVLAVALNLSPESALRFVIDPLSLTRIDRLESNWRVLSVNESVGKKNKNSSADGIDLL